jgi:hypothetical protein
VSAEIDARRGGELRSCACATELDEGQLDVGIARAHVDVYRAIVPHGASLT